MKTIECPSDPSPQTCAYNAASWMADNELIVLNPLGDGKVVIDHRASSSFETLTILGTDKSSEDNLYLGCLACKRIVKITDTLDGMSVSNPV